MKKDKLVKLLNSDLARFLLVFFGIGFVFFIWWIISFSLKSIYFPGPEIVIPLFFNMLGEGETYVNIGWTLLRMLISFICSFAVALILGLISGLCKPVRNFLKPLVIVIKTIPTAALILSLVVFLRYQYSLFVIVFLVMFPILYEAIVSGITNIDEYILNALRIDANLYSAKSIFSVVIPCASPYILLGIVQTLGLGLKVSIMAEVMVGSTKAPGIGIAMYQAWDLVEHEIIFAYSLYAIILIGLLDFLLHFFKKKLKSQIKDK